MCAGGSVLRGKARVKAEAATIKARPDRAVWLLPVVLLGAALAYSPGLSAPFIYDDLSAIRENPHIRHLWPLREAMSAPEQTPLAGRPVVSLSLAVNYAIGGIDVRGYHAFNLAVHLISAVLLFAIARRTLHSHLLHERYTASAGWIALAVAAIWALHPLQTESVIYVVQRTELLMGLFYVLTLYCAIRGSRSARPWFWHTAAVSACALGMASKEVMVSAPLIVLLHDRVFISGSFRGALARRPGLYAGLALTWVLLGVLLASGPRSESIGFNHGV
ncbi:MAG: hypothetical protein ACYS7M_02205, partial [Planctomycetota bacterium]